jgi:plasmid stabilization system protein ParE
MTRNVRILAEAEDELAAAALWYEERRVGLGVRFMAAVDASVVWLARAPDSCPIWLAGYPYRKLVMQRFPYVVFFRLVDDGIEIVAFAHAKRTPGYWLDRSR